MNEIKIKLPPSFDTVMKESMDSTNLEIDSVAREGYVIGILASFCETVGREDVAEQLREGNAE